MLGALVIGQLAAFPGAEGFGAVATGGRGGRVMIVETLASEGPGSLGEALATCEPRIVVFRVSGVIEGDQEIACGDLTIAGQTAPGAGITIAGRLIGAYDTSVGNIIIRHVRVRPPPLTEVDPDLGPQYDAIQLSRQRRVILDHVSVSWASDETIDLYEAQDVTLQWVSIEESSTEGHPEGRHNYGLINGPDGARVTIHHSLCAHHYYRCPALATGPAEVVNNVVYDVRQGFLHNNPATGEFHITGNVFRAGPSADLFPFYFDDEDPGGASYYLRDNHIDDPGVFVGEVDDIWQEPYLHPTFADALGADGRIDAPTDFGHAITEQAPLDAYALVLEGAGAFPRDVVTRRTIDEVTARTGGWGAAPPADLLEGLTPGTPPTDADDDGMADDWELAHRLDPTDGTDHTTTMPSGYTAIEDYINGLADGAAPTPPGVDAGPGGAGDPDGGPGAGAGGAAVGCCDAGATGAAPTGLAVLGLALIGRRRRRRR